MSVTDLKGVSSLGELSLTEIIRENMVSFLDWGFINKGAYFNINLSSSSPYGGNYDRLRPVEDPRYTDGQVWEAYRKDWVWQSGLDVSTQPIQVSGVYVNSTFYPLSTTGGFSHYINYPLGRIIFNTAISTTSTVTAEFSPKFIHVTEAKNIPLFRSIQRGSFRVDDPTFLQAGSGNWGVLADSRVQLPMVAVELGRVEYTPYEIGGGQNKFTDVLFHILAENDDVNTRLSDIISQQKEKTIFLYDPNMMKNDSQAILDYNGSITTGTKTYPQLVAESGGGGYRYQRLRISDSESEPGDWLSSTLYHSTVRFQTQVVVGSI